MDHNKSTDMVFDNYDALNNNIRKYETSKQKKERKKRIN